MSKYTQAQFTLPAAIATLAVSISWAQADPQEPCEAGRPPDTATPPSPDAPVK
jgi:hypothetical protein